MGCKKMYYIYIEEIKEEREDRQEFLHKLPKKRERRRYFLMQKMVGIAVIAFTVLAVKLLEGDATIALVTIPLGLLILTSKEPVIMTGYFWEVEE